jgi:hypothetical protein
LRIFRRFLQLVDVTRKIVACRNSNKILIFEIIEWFNTWSSTVPYASNQNPIRGIIYINILKHRKFTLWRRTHYPRDSRSPRIFGFVNVPCQSADAPSANSPNNVLGIVRQDSIIISEIPAPVKHVLISLHCPRLCDLCNLSYVHQVELYLASHDKCKIVKT